MEKVAFDMWKRYYSPLSQLATCDSLMFMRVWLENYYDFRRALDGAGSLSTIKDETLFNENLDLEYIALLVVADGIVTCETRGRMLQTAKAFFPNRIVWSSLRDGL
jgi:hypothetical protein